MRKHKLTGSTIQKDTTIRLNFEGGSWAAMTFIQLQNDWTDVSITSDWGSWSYGWSKSGNSWKTIFEFMASRSDQGYFTGKFMGKEKSVFNAKKSCTILRKRIREEVKWIYEKEKYETLMYQVSELENCETDESFIHEYFRHDELKEVCGDEPWFSTVFETHPRTHRFFKDIYPKFVPQIRKLHKESLKNKAKQ
jgi:hypothetical protein